MTSAAVELSPRGVSNISSVRVKMRVMARLNLTLDDDTLAALSREARQAGVGVATHARQVLAAAVARHQLLQRRRVWAEAYRADRGDAGKLAADLEPATFELLGDEDA
jgi:post-segregation antitoxin (ccd killing protein)